MGEKPRSAMQQMPSWAVQLHKKCSGDTHEIIQSNMDCSEEERAEEKASLSTSQEGTGGHSGLFFRPQPHGRPSDVSIKPFPCIRKDVEPHLDCQESTILLYANDTPTWQCTTSAEMPSLTLMTQVSAVWRGQPAVLDKEEIL